MTLLRACNDHLTEAWNKEVEDGEESLRGSQGLHGCAEIKGSQAEPRLGRAASDQSQMNFMTNILKIWVMRGAIETPGGACEIRTVTPDKKELHSN